MSDNDNENEANLYRLVSLAQSSEAWLKNIWRVLMFIAAMLAIVAYEGAQIITLLMAHSS